MSAVAFGQNLTVTHATLIDGTGAAAMQDVTIVVRDGRIAEIAASGSPFTSSGQVINLGGRYLLPGLIDGHAHLLSPDSAQRALESGVTTVRVMGDRNLQALGTRDLINQGHVPGAEFLVSGDIIRPFPGMAFFVTFPEYGQYAVAGLRGPTTIRSVVRTFLDRGVDQIKVGASERAGLFTTDPRRPELTLEEIQAAVAEARKDGKFVEAHAHAESGVAAAVGAGVRSVAHGTYANETTSQLMKTRGTFLVPTLAIMSPLGDPTGDTENAIALQVRTRHMETAVRSVVWKAKQLGIPIVAATDGSYAATGASARVRLQHDMEAMLRPDSVQWKPLPPGRVMPLDWRESRVAPERSKSGSRPICSSSIVILSPTSRRSTSPSLSSTTARSS